MDLPFRKVDFLLLIPDIFAISEDRKVVARKYSAECCTSTPVAAMLFMESCQFAHPQMAPNHRAWAATDVAPEVAAGVERRVTSNPALGQL